MKVPEYRRISKGDFPPNPEPESKLAIWMGRVLDVILEPINQTLERLTSLAQRKNTFDDNYNSSTNTIKVTNSDEFKFTAKIRGQPISVQIEQVKQHFSVRSFDWNPTARAQEVKVIVCWDVPPLNAVDVTFRTFGR